MEGQLVNSEEQEIVEFFRNGLSVAQIAECTGFSKYQLKKLLANEPSIQPLGYIWRSLYPSNENLNLIWLVKASIIDTQDGEKNMKTRKPRNHVVIALMKRNGAGSHKKTTKQLRGKWKRNIIDV